MFRAVPGEVAVVVVVAAVTKSSAGASKFDA